MYARHCSGAIIRFSDNSSFFFTVSVQVTGVELQKNGANNVEVDIDVPTTLGAIVNPVQADHPHMQ